MATLRRVTIHRLRNVRPGCSFELHAGLNVLLGRNGTGKTTLLQWLADFLSGDMRAWADEPYHVELDLEVESEGGTARIHVETENPGTGLRLRDGRRISKRLMQEKLRHDDAAWKTAASLEIGEARFEFQALPTRLDVKLNEFPLEPMRRDLSLAYDSGFRFVIWAPLSWLCDVKLREEPPWQRVLEPAKDALMSVVKQMKHAYGEVLRYDESLGFFDRIVTSKKKDPFEDGQASLLVVESRGTIQFTDPVLIPEALVKCLDPDLLKSAETPSREVVRTAKDLGSFLARAVELFEHQDGELRVSLLEKTSDPQGDIYHYGDLRFFFHLRDGSIIGHDALSYGQKRMLSFLYYLALNPRFIVVDELVNGLHHAWLQACIEEIGDRQGLLTSQNPLLLDYLTFESVEDVRTRFVLCRSEYEGDREQLVWRNPTEEEAQSFFTAYQAGIQHVSEILADKGLW